MQGMALLASRGRALLELQAWVGRCWALARQEQGLVPGELPPALEESEPEVGWACRNSVESPPAAQLGTALVLLVSEQAERGTSRRLGR